MISCRYLRNIILCGIVIAFTAGCRSPVITFPTSDITINAEESISFSSESYPNAIYQWTFDGGAPDRYEQNPTVQFDRAGIYNVCLTVVFEDLESGFDNLKITVNGPLNQNVRLVNPGESIQSAIDGITDASSQNPYVVVLFPGIHDCSMSGILMKENIHLRGYGAGITIVEVAEENTLSVCSNSSIRDLTIVYSGSGPGAITANRLISYFTLDGLEIKVFGGSSGIFINTPTQWNRIWMHDVRIITEGKGIHVNTAGYYYLRDVDVFLTGDGIGSPHVGLQVDGESRFYIWGGKIGTEYGYPGVENDVDQDVIGIFISVYNSKNPRIELHGLESFCKNEGATPATNVNVIRAEAGWVRCFGCFGQSETPPDWDIGKTLYQSGNGKIECFGSRFTQFEGKIFGAPQRGLSIYDVSSDGHELKKFEGGLVLLDASEGPFTIKMPSWLGPRRGEEYIFKKIDATSNTVTIKGSGRNIDGQPSIALTTQYKTLKIIGGYDEWYTF